MGITERIRHRLGLRSSNAAQPHRNRYRGRHDGADWLADWEEEIEVWEPSHECECVLNPPWHNDDMPELWIDKIHDYVDEGD